MRYAVFKLSANHSEAKLEIDLRSSHRLQKGLYIGFNGNQWY